MTVFAVSAHILSEWAEVVLPSGSTRYAQAVDTELGAMLYSRADNLNAAQTLARTLIYRWIGNATRGGYARPHPVAAGYLYTDAELGQDRGGGKRRGGTWSYFPIAWDKDTQTLQFAIVEYGASVRLDMRPEGALLGDASRASEALNGGLGFTPAHFAWGHTPWGNLSVALFIALDAVTPARHTRFWPATGGIRHSFDMSAAATAAASVPPAPGTPGWFVHVNQEVLVEWNVHDEQLYVPRKDGHWSPTYDYASQCESESCNIVRRARARARAHSSPVLRSPTCSTQTCGRARAAASPTAPISAGASAPR